ncbi:hypothetical protein BJY54_003281 [Streptomyces nodosus]|uniref:Uncharacterized protein n=1 Tax=Streptomyces nodosus TaxID=40318 RepID=A0A0B5DJQ2_9ACTN|nr:hypothetical protein SNOD_16705 [Streptomyces nodosus]MBB4792669.1 hypothetical protein [Streptomyces nodosus]QEV40014.1 hypothetical protein CP978_16985 [Streptomyces nodosus]
MLNRIRRALSLTRVRNSSRGRHRRPLTPSSLPVVPAVSLEPGGALIPALSRDTAGAAGRPLLRGEDVALVRLYVLAWERRERTRTVIVAPHLPADAWPQGLVGVR